MELHRIGPDKQGRRGNRRSGTAGRGREERRQNRRHERKHRRVKVERKRFFRVVDEMEVETVKGTVEEGRKGTMAVKWRVHREAGGFLFPARMEETKEDTRKTDLLFLSKRGGEDRQMSHRERKLVLLVGHAKPICSPPHPSQRQSTNRLERRCTL